MRPERSVVRTDASDRCGVETAGALPGPDRSTPNRLAAAPTSWLAILGYRHITTGGSVHVLVLVDPDVVPFRFPFVPFVPEHELQRF